MDLVIQVGAVTSTGDTVGFSAVLQTGLTVAGSSVLLLV